MAVKWMSKKDLMIRIPTTIVLVVLVIAGKYYKKTHPKIPANISAVGIAEGKYSIFDIEHNECGSLQIRKLNDEDIAISINGNKIKGYDSINKPYTLNAINYADIPMKPVTKDYETFYLGDTGKSFLILLKIREKSNYLVKKFTREKGNDIYVFSEISYEYYKHLLNYSNMNMEIHHRCCVSFDDNLYTCFIQK